MKKIWTGFAVVLLLTMVFSLAFGEIQRPYGPGQMGYDAVVISKNVSIRPTQRANAKAVGRKNYGDRFAAMPLGNGWCEVYLSETEGLS